MVTAAGVWAAATKALYGERFALLSRSSPVRQHSTKDASQRPLPWHLHAAGDGNDKDQSCRGVYGVN
jgi:hypothetical protein